MDLEVVGRHALLFDDDATAAFVNSKDALVEWNSLCIDRYDVRHLLSAPPPPRKRSSQPSLNPDDALELEIERERYLDFPSSSPCNEEPDKDNDVEVGNASGYRAVRFSYGEELAEQKNTDAESGFRPPFSVPDSLLQNLPLTEKVHQIISRTAMFVSKHGGQSEIILRVKQGDNPTFGFLMPDHHLHPYFRFLVDHQELLNGKSLEGENKADSGAGALSLLGSVYGEDEDGATEDVPQPKGDVFEEAVNTANVAASSSYEQIESSVKLAGKDNVSKHPLHPLREKTQSIRRNGSISKTKAGTASTLKKDVDRLGSLSAATKSEASILRRTSKVDRLVVEPPSELKRVIDKIVEFIVKNGKQFEAVLIEQDSKHGRFPFLLPSNLYHPYYLQVLQKTEESKLSGKGLISEKHEATGPRVDKKTSLSDTAGSDIPYESDRKEKFKMVIGKSKKDAQELPSKTSQQEVGVSVDAAAAAAILQAATRGIKNPNFGFLSRTSSNGTSQGPSGEGRQSSSQPQNSIQEVDQRGKPTVTVPVANAIAKTAAIAAASEADSSEASLTKEQKLKAERLRRAKLFTAMLKSGTVPVKSEPSRGASVEPPESGISGSGTEVSKLVGKEREGSSAPIDVDASEKTEKFEKKDSGDDNNERRSKRRYRSRTERCEEEEENDEERGEEEDESEEMDNKPSQKRRKSHRSSHHGKDGHKHRKRHSSSKDRGSRHRHKHDSSSDVEHHHSRRRHKHTSISKDEHDHSRRRHKHDGYNDDTSDNEHRHSRHQSEHDDLSDEKHQHRRRSDKCRKRSRTGREAELEEGEICSKSDQSKASERNGASREASVDISKSYQEGQAPSELTETTEVSNDLRAKIRAMLMATL